MAQLGARIIGTNNVGGGFFEILWEVFAPVSGTVVRSGSLKMLQTEIQKRDSRDFENILIGFLDELARENRRQGNTIQNPRDLVGITIQKNV